MIECWGRCAQCDSVVELIPHYHLPMPVSAVIRWLSTARCPCCNSHRLLWEVDPHNSPRRGDKVWWEDETMVRESRENRLEQPAEEEKDGKTEDGI